MVVAIEVDEVQAAQKPCFYKAAGLPKGAYLRVGNTNRQMSEYEVFGYVSGRGQPQHDAEVVPDATLDRDIPEYPLDAVREVIANAVAHRDYSPYVRGSYIQIRLFADRIEVQSPGGLFGNVNIENLEEQHSTRNARLMRILEDLHVVENRGSGIGSMLRALREANLEPPRFDDRRSSFWVTIRNHTLMNPTAIAWLNQFADRTINDRQRLALVYFRQRGQIANADYRRLNHVDSTVAGQELRGLVQQGLVAQDGVGRGTTYRLVEVSGKDVPQEVSPADSDRVLEHVTGHGSISNGECRTLLGVSDNRAYYILDKLASQGCLRPEGKGRWRRYVKAG